MGRRRPASRRSRRASSSTTSVSATEAQNNFGRVLGQAASEGAIYITRYDRPAAVVLSIERYRALTEPEGDDLDEIGREFDEMVARMQTSGAAAAVDALFAMDSAELGDAAVLGARRAKK